MIVKELDPFVDKGDVFARAGHQAEKQMAYYLQRAFGESESVSVLNGLRLERNGDFAQIDHLIIHRGGMVIIESKSVHGTVSVNEHGEWTRVFGRQRQGMASPIEQANRQAKFLKDFLNDHAPQIGGKILGLFQIYFGYLTVDVVVAVSDSGIIERPKKRQLPEVCKADQAVDKVKDLFSRHKQEAKSFKIDFENKRGRELSRSELNNIINLLPASHVPVAHTASPATTVTEAEPPVPLPAMSPLVVPPAPPAVSEEKRSSNCVCVSCHKPLTPKEEEYCREYAKRFGGKFFCYPHQRNRVRAKVEL